MLQVTAVKENFENFVNGLKKRGIQNAEEQLNELIQLDDERKKTQQSLDDILANSNLLAKKIGQLYKEGKKKRLMLPRQKPANSKKKASS